MVHRIHNRNPGYSDFSNIGSSQSIQFFKTEGATALASNPNYTMALML